jgi:uncharacterized protein (TIGR01777 family)
VKVVIAGGTGALGRRIADNFAAIDAGGSGQSGGRHEVVVLTRSLKRGIEHRQVLWDGRNVGAWADELADAVVVNLAGELVDRRPSAANIELLRRSRAEPTLALAAAAAQCATSPRLWLQMSTLAIYGDAGQGIIDETHPSAEGPPQMAGVALAWEAAAAAVCARRVVVMRTGVVLDPGTPALNRLTRLTRFGFGGQIARGAQWVSWMHVDDFIRALRFIVDHDDLDGIVHLTSPNPIQNREMMAALRAVLHRPWSPPTPRVLVHLGALLMRTDPALALTGRRCVPARLTGAGFAFHHPDFPAALADLLAR